jgi:hypothetical protein
MTQPPQRQRLVPLLGVAAPMLLVVGNELTKIGGSSPALNASAGEYAESIGPSPVVVVGIFLVITAWLTIFGFFASLAERLRERPGSEHPARLITGGAVLAAAVGVCGALPLLAATLMARDGDLSPEIAKALLLMNAAVFVVGWLLLAVPMAVASVTGLRTSGLPRWLGRSGAGVATALAVGSVAVWWIQGLLVVWLLALLWMIVTGITLALGNPRTEPTPARNLAGSRS